MFLQNFGIRQQDLTVSQRSRPQSEPYNDMAPCAVLELCVK
jgi:hypothetical protein